MHSLSEVNLSPDLVVGRSEHHRLLLLAMAKADQDAASAADWLLSELDRAMIVADHSVPSNVVRMRSVVRYRTSGGDERTVRLVFPGDADIADGRISILTPVGAALIGLREGQSISYRTRDGRRQALTVLRVFGSPEGEDPSPMAA